jgi:hypothetical protein
MKITYLLLASFLIISSCKEEDDIIITLDPNAPSFVCTIAGTSFSDNTPTIDINSSDMMSINLSDGTYDLSFRIYNFSSISVNDAISFSIPSMGLVTYGGSTYSSTYNGPPYDGEFVFTTLEVHKLSGTFNFKAQDVDPNMFTNITVKDGVFENIAY